MSLTRKRIGNALRIGVTVVLLALLVRAVDLRQVWALLASARPLPLAGAVLLYCVVGTYVRGERWRALVVALGQPIRVTRTMALFLVGTFFGQALPTGIGGDVVRALVLARDGLGRARALSTVLVDRALGLLPLLATGWLALALAPERATPVVAGMLLVAGAVGLGGMFVLLRTHHWRGRLDRVPFVGWLVTRPGIARFIDSFGAYGNRGLAVATTWSVGFIVLLVAANLLLGRAVGITSAGWLDWAIVVPLASLSLLLPSVGGWGVREWTYVGLLGTLDPPVDVNAATAVSVLFGGLNLVLAAAGGLVAAAGGSLGLPEEDLRRGDPE